MGNNSSGKYMLVFEPKYTYHQFAVYFTPSSDVKVTEIKKYTDLPYSSLRNTRVKKNLLGDIDKVTTKLKDEREFFDKYIDPSIFIYTGGNLHRIFIGYKNNNSMHCLKCVFNNPKLNEKTLLLNGSKTDDHTEIRDLMNLFTDPESDFLQFVIETKNKKRQDYFYSVSSEVIAMALNLRNTRMLMQRDGERALLDDYQFLETKLRTRLSSYKEYRELFLMKCSYIEELEKRKNELQKMKNEVVNNHNIFDTPSCLNQLQAYEQISIFDSEKVKIKTKDNEKH